MARTTPGTGIPVPESPDPRTITADLWASFSKVGTLITQTSGESAAALTASEGAQTTAAQALARAVAIEEPVHVGPNPPTDGEALWVDTDEDAPPAVGSVSSEDITDATDVGRAVLTAPLSANARNALSIFTGTRALLDEGTDTAERTWDAKELHEYVTDTAGAASWDDLTGKPTVFPPAAHQHPVSDVAGLVARLAALEYDSGTRNVTTEWLSAFTSETNYLTVQRTGKSVSCSLYARKFDRAGTTFGTALFTLPVGFRPRAIYRIPCTFPANAQLTVHTNGTVTSHGANIPVDTVVSFQFSHPTGDPTPSNLPGTPA